MKENDLFKILYWLFFIAAIVAFWISLRTDIHAVEYTFLALAFWGVAFFINKKYLKKE